MSSDGSYRISRATNVYRVVRPGEQQANKQQPTGNPAREKAESSSFVPAVPAKQANGKAKKTAGNKATTQDKTKTKAKKVVGWHIFFTVIICLVLTAVYTVGVFGFIMALFVFAIIFAFLRLL